MVRASQGNPCGFAHGDSARRLYRRVSSVRIVAMNVACCLTVMLDAIPAESFANDQVARSSSREVKRIRPAQQLRMPAS